GPLGGRHLRRDRGAPACARPLYGRELVSRLGRLGSLEWSYWRSRHVRVVATLVVSGLAAAYVLWKIDLSKTVEILRNANLGYFFAGLAIMFVTVWPMAWRWQRLLRARGIQDLLGWLTRAYFVSYTAGQVLPTTVGGDAARIYETSRRHPGRGGAVAG